MVDGLPDADRQLIRAAAKQSQVHLRTLWDDYNVTARKTVEAAGGTLDDVCRVDVYVRNMEHFDAIHKVRREYFKPPAPASTMVEICKMTSPDYLIEINAIAVIAD